MFIKQITYHDYDGNKRTENFYFHLSSGELLEMELTEKGGYGKKLEAAILSGDNTEIFKVIKELIRKSYGVKSPDGREFVKSEDELNKFLRCPAYSIFLLDLFSSVDKIADFVNKIVPKDLADKVEKMKAEGTLPTADTKNSDIEVLSDNTESGDLNVVTTHK